MNNCLKDLLGVISGYNNKLTNDSLLINQHWVLINEKDTSKIIYIFGEDKVLFVSKNGKITKGKWDLIGENSLYIEREDGVFLFRHRFLNEHILILKVDGDDNLFCFINESKYVGLFDNISQIEDFMKTKYNSIISGGLNKQKSTISRDLQYNIDKPGITTVNKTRVDNTVSIPKEKLNIDRKWRIIEYIFVLTSLLLLLLYDLFYTNSSCLKGGNAGPMLVNTIGLSYTPLLFCLYYLKLQKADSSILQIFVIINFCIGFVMFFLNICVLLYIYG